MRIKGACHCGRISDEIELGPDGVSVCQRAAARAWN